MYGISFEVDDKVLQVISAHVHDACLEITFPS